MSLTLEVANNFFDKAVSLYSLDEMTPFSFQGQPYIFLSKKNIDDCRDDVLHQVLLIGKEGLELTQLPTYTMVCLDVDVKIIASLK